MSCQCEVCYCDLPPYIGVCDYCRAGEHSSDLRINHYVESKDEDKQGS